MSALSKYVVEDICKNLMYPDLLTHSTIPHFALHKKILVSTQTTVVSHYACASLCYDLSIYTIKRRV